MTKKIDHDITSKSTKADILDAYEDLRKKLEESQKEAPATKKVQEKVKQEEAKVVEAASSYSIGHIITKISDLKLSVDSVLNELSGKLIDEARKLEELRSAIQIEEKYIEEVQDIKISADALSLLIQEYDEKKSNFEKERREAEEQFNSEVLKKREEFKREQEEYKAALKEKNAELEKARKREQEEYDYNLKIVRKKDKDVYEQNKQELERELKEKKAKQEKEFADRENELSARETELNELRKKVESFDSLLDKAVKKAEKDTADATEQKAKIQAQLLAKEKETETKLLELKNRSLDEELKKQAKEIEVLRNQLAEANQKVLEIATKAIEGASGAKTLSTIQEIAMEQAKFPKMQK